MLFYHAAMPLFLPSYLAHSSQVLGGLISFVSIVFPKSASLPQGCLPGPPNLKYHSPITLTISVCLKALTTISIYEINLCDDLLSISHNACRLQESRTLSVLFIRVTVNCVLWHSRWSIITCQLQELIHEWVDAHVYHTVASWKGRLYFIISNYWGTHKEWQLITVGRVTGWVAEPLNAHRSPDAQVQLHHAPVVFVWCDPCVVYLLCILRGNKSYIRWDHFLDASLAFPLNFDSFVTFLSSHCRRQKEVVILAFSS